MERLIKHRMTLDSLRMEADQAQTFNIRAGSWKSGACSVGLSHAGCAKAHEAEPGADERIAMDAALSYLDSRRSMCDENSAVLRDAEKKAQSVLDPVD